MAKTLYTLEVFILEGLMTEKLVKANPSLVSRTIEILGLQTLEQLHRAIFRAFDRWDDCHLYEFQFGTRPHDPNGDRYGIHFPDERPLGPFNVATLAGDVAKTSIDSLGLAVGRAFGYRFDFGDEWYHQISVTAIGDAEPEVRYPRVIARVGESPPQHLPLEDEGDECTAGPPDPPDDLQGELRTQPPRRQRRGTDSQPALQFDDE